MPLILVTTLLVSSAVAFDACRHFMVGINKNDSSPICYDGPPLTDDAFYSSVTSANQEEIGSGNNTQVMHKCENGYVRSYEVSSDGKMFNVTCFGGESSSPSSGFNVLTPPVECKAYHDIGSKQYVYTAVKSIVVDLQGKPVSYSCEPLPHTEVKDITASCVGRGLIDSIRPDKTVICNGQNDVAYQDKYGIYEATPVETKKGEYSVSCDHGFMIELSLGSKLLTKAICTGSPGSPLADPDFRERLKTFSSLKEARSCSTLGMFAVHAITVDEYGYINAVTCAAIDIQKIDYSHVKIPEFVQQKANAQEGKNETASRAGKRSLFQQSGQSVWETTFNQASSGNCAYLATLISAAFRAPQHFVADRKDDVGPNGISSECTVTLYDNQLQPKKYTDNCYIGGSELKEKYGDVPEYMTLFLVAAERMLNEQGRSTLDGNSLSKTYRMFTGKNAADIDLVDLENVSFADYIADDKLSQDDSPVMALATYPNRDLLSGTGLTPRHGYSLISYRDGVFILYDPHGDRTKEITLPGVQKLYGKNGLFAIPEAHVRKYFYYISFPCNIAPKSPMCK